MTFIIGTGLRVHAGRIRAACRINCRTPQQRETPRMAFAPKFALFGVCCRLRQHHVIDAHLIHFLQPSEKIGDLAAGCIRWPLERSLPLRRPSCHEAQRPQPVRRKPSVPSVQSSHTAFVVTSTSTVDAESNTLTCMISMILTLVFSSPISVDPDSSTRLDESASSSIGANESAPHRCSLRT